MTQDFYTILTNNGLNKQIQCLEKNETFDIAYIAVGDGNGEPLESQTSLKNEKWRGEILSHGVSDNKLFANISVPIDVGNFTIREIGLFDSQNTLLCVGKCPTIEKHNSTLGGAQELFITIYMAITNGNLAPLIVQSSKEMASKDYVNDKFANKDLNNLSLSGQKLFDYKQNQLITGEGISISNDVITNTGVLYEELGAVNIELSWINISGLLYEEI